MNTEGQGTDLGDEEGMASYEEIWSNIVLAGEIVLTVTPEDVSPLKTGIKNTKSRQAAENKAHELPPVMGTLVFNEVPSPSIVGAIDVTITLVQRGSIRILASRIPDTEM